MSRDIRQTILSRIDPERVSVAIDVERLSTASDSSSMFLPFPPITSLDDKKIRINKKKRTQKKVSVNLLLRLHGHVTAGQAHPLPTRVGINC